MARRSPARWLSSREVARRLGLDASRVRRLAAAERLPAEKIGHDWAFDAELLDNAAIKRQKGRPFSPESALGLLFLASSEEAPWLLPRARSRLRRLSGPDVLRALPRLRGRAERRAYRAPESLLRRLADDPGFVLSGVSASAAHGARIVSKGVLEGYLDKARLRDLEYRYAMEPVSERAANLVVHALDRRLLPARRVMPRAVVAADLADSVDERSRKVGAQLLRELR